MFFFYLTEDSASFLYSDLTCVGESGSYTMYLDDGVSRSSAPDAEADDPKAANEYRETSIQHVYNRDTKSRRVTVERVHKGYTPMETYFYVRLLHAPEEIVDKTTGKI